MIIWLASYPKSGNTWVRLFLNSLIFTPGADLDINNVKIDQFPLRRHFKRISSNTDDVKEIIKNCNRAQSELNLKNKINFFKTHSSFWKISKYSFTDVKNTIGTIHIVRDPRNVITSIKNHYNHESYERALKFIKDENNTIGAKGSKREEDLPVIVSSWKFHYNSWKSITSLKSKYILIKYENLLRNPIDEFTKIVNFIKEIASIEFDEKNILKAIENTSFENLKKQEELKGFKEAPKNNNKFFYLGPKNDWHNILDKKTKDDVEASFKNEMKDLGYL